MEARVWRRGLMVFIVEVFGRMQDRWMGYLEGLEYYQVHVEKPRCVPQRRASGITPPTHAMITHPNRQAPILSYGSEEDHHLASVIPLQSQRLEQLLLLVPLLQTQPHLPPLAMVPLQRLV